MNVKPHRFFTVLTLLTSAGAQLSAQISDANLTGSVLDVTGAAVPNASLEAVHTQTRVRYSAKSDGAGRYRFNNLPVGLYNLRGSAEGFATATVQDIDLDLARTQTVNISLQVASMRTAVEVVQALPALDTTTPNLQTTFNTRQAVELPITGAGMLGVVNLSMLSAGVGSPGGVGYGTGPSVGGQRPTNNNFMIEGVDNNNRASTGPVISLSNEAVEEFSLQANQFSPEFGHSSGGQFNTILKSGTNELHGSGYEYFMNRHLNAIDESFRRQGVLSNPRFDQNRLGITLGGPAIRNKLFYFGSFESQRQGQAATSPSAIYAPTTEGFQILDNLGAINRTNFNVLRSYVPAAASRTRDITVLGQQIPVGILRTSGPSYMNDTRPVVSADYNVSERDQLRVRWIGYRTDSLENTAALPGFFTPIQIRNQIASAAFFHTFSANTTSETRLGFNRAVEDRPVGSYDFPGLDAFPNLQFNDLILSVGPHQAYPQSNRSNVFQLAQNISSLKGRHTLKVGYDGRKVNSSNFFIQMQRGQYEYSTLERYLLDITPEFAQRSVGGLPFAGNLLSHYAFVNDEIRLRSNLTLTVGLRYEFVDVPAGSKLQALNSVSDVPGVLQFRAPKADRSNFAPRAGLAWSPGTSGRTSLRAGFGLAYDQNYLNTAMNSLPPQFFTTVSAHVDRPNQPSFLEGGGIVQTVAPVTDPASARASTSTFIPDQQRPYSIQWNAGVQHVFGKDYTMEVRYLGTRGVHLPSQIQMNRQAGVESADRSLPTYLERPSQATLDSLPLTLNDLSGRNTLASAGFGRTITSYVPRGNSTYHGLATQLTRRFSNGMQFALAHTWSHNIDDGTAVVSSTVLTPRRAQDFFNLRAERADSALDHRHRFTAAWIYDTPWFHGHRNFLLRRVVADWNFSGTYTAETGTWATVQSGIDSNLNGDLVGDRTVINPNGDGTRSSGVTALVNSSGKTVAYLARDASARYIQAGAGAYANSGRNTLRLPGINNFDIGIGKRVNVSEKAFIQFRAEAYNALNHAQFVPGFPSSANLRPRVAAGSTGLVRAGNALFNRPDLAFESNARTMQLVARLQF